MSKIPDHVRRYITTHNTLSLATTDGERAWAASVFYATDDELSFYFVSDPQTQHCLDIATGRPVAATINDDHSDWNDISGIQISGLAEPLPPARRDHVEHLYLTKFQGVRELFEAPGTEQERVIAERLKAAQYYKISPLWLRYIDNSRAFGHKEEFALAPQDLGAK